MAKFLGFLLITLISSPVPLVLADTQTHLVRESFTQCRYQGYYGVALNECLGVVSCASEAGKLRYTACQTESVSSGKPVCPSAVECANDETTKPSAEAVQTYLCETLDASETHVLPRTGCKLSAQNYHESQGAPIQASIPSTNSTSPSGLKTGQAIAR